MALSRQPWRWNKVTDSFDGTTPDGNVTATTFTAGASNTDGAVTTLVTSLAHDVQYIKLWFGGCNANGGDGQVAADLLVDPAGGSSWTALINDLAVGFSVLPSSAGGGMGLSYEFGLWIPSGSNIGIRAKTAHTSDILSCRCVYYLYGEPSDPELAPWYGTAVETLGISDSRGTAVTPGGSGTMGSWTSIGSTTSQRYGQIQFGINGTDNAAAGAASHWQVGYGSNRVPGTPTIHKTVSTNEAGGTTGGGPMPVDIPAGTQMQLRASSSGASPEVHYGVIYGVY